MNFLKQTKGRLLRCYIFFVFLAVFQIQSVIAQTPNPEKVTIKVEKHSLQTVFDELSRQTGFKFFYGETIVNDKLTVSLNYWNVPIDTVLDEVTKQTHLYFKKENNTISVSRREYSQKELIAVTPVRKRSGIVVGQQGESIIGANILLKGTTIGVTTDIDGKFNVDVPDNGRLIISYIGYTPQEINVTDKSTLKIQLKEDVLMLNEVVAIGYGTKTKSTLTGSVSTVSKESLENRPVARTTDLLQGVAAGVQIRRTNAGRIRGTNSDIVIRGVTSSSNPGVLVVIDGIAQKDNNTYALDNINPDDIENVSILKDAQAAIYGARAAGGVILVTTKQGKTAKPTIQFSGTYTIQTPSLMRKGTDILQITEMMNEGFVNDGQNTNMFSHIAKYIADNKLTMDMIRQNDGKYSCQWPFDNSANFVFGDYNWPDIMFAPAPMQNYNLSVSGKTSKLNYYNSVGFVGQEAMLNYANNSNQRFFVKIKNDYDITSFLKVKTNFDFERQKVVEPTRYDQVEFWQGLIWPVFMPYNSKGNLYNFGSHQNPIGYAQDAGNTTDLNYRIKALIGVVLNPIENLTVTGEYSASFDINENEWSNLGFDMYDENDKYSYNSNNGRNAAGSSFGRSRYSVANVYANYKYTLLKDNQFDFMLGYSHEEEDWRKFDAYRNLGLISNELPTMGLGSTDEQYNSEAKTDRALNSVFSRIGYTYNNRYLLEGTFRYDGSSKFAKGQQWSPFFGISGAWNVSNEKFMSRFDKVIDFLKIRASWGQMGNESSIGLYDYIAQMNIGGSYPMGNPLSPNQTQNAALAGLASNTRTWEKIETKNIGLDLSTIQSRLTGSVDFYVKDNSNMFFIKEFPQVLGVVAPSINGAHVQTKGWEINVGWADKIGNVGYSASFNLSDNTSKVISLADATIPRQGYNSFVEGYPVGAYFGYKFDGFIQNKEELDAYNAKFQSGIPNNITVGDAKYRDMDGDGKLLSQAYQLGKDGKPTSTSGDLVHIGDEGQHYLFGINLGANWKNIDFSVFFQGVLKWQVMESNKPIENNSWPPHEYFYGQYWNENNRDAVHPRLSQNDGIKNYDYQTSDAPYKFYNNRYIRLKNVQLGYTIPKELIQKIKVEKLRIYFSGTDIWEAYSIPGIYDPEKPFNPRITPFPRGFSFGLNLTL